MKFKRLWLVTLLTYACITASVAMAEAGGFRGEPRGFDGFSWGMSQDKLGQMRYVGKDASGTILFERQGEESHFGKAKIASIDYGFKDGRLTAVRIKVDSLLQYLLLNEEATKRYGAGVEMPGKKGSYFWRGEQTEITLVGNFTES